MGGAYAKNSKWVELENRRWEELTRRTASGWSLRTAGGRSLREEQQVGGAYAGFHRSLKFYTFNAFS